MVIGIIIAIILAALGAPLGAAIGVGVGYAVIAFVVTPRELGGLSSARAGAARSVASPPDSCSHPKIANGHCRDVLCWNFEPDVEEDPVTGQICPHTKDADRRCFIPLCWNSRMADNPAAARALDAEIRRRVTEHADRTFAGSGVDWRKEYGGLEGLIGAMASEEPERSSRRQGRSTRGARAR